MFDDIAFRYDFLNHFLSAGIDRRWRLKLVGEAVRCRPRRMLDVATGTADVAIMAARKDPQAMIEGVDLSQEMLRIGRQKVEKLGLSGQITLSRQDAAQMAFEDGTFDTVTASFGVRNFEDLGKGLAEMRRVTRKGGTVCILEFSMPDVPLISGIYRFYFSKILPLLGKNISENDQAYTYLFRSASEFPRPQEFIAILKEAGFESVRARTMTGGIVSLYVARK